MDVKKIKKHHLHDYEIGKIIIDYNEGIIQIQLFDPKGAEDELIIDGFTNIDIVRKEEWGKSKYIAASDMEEVGSFINAYIQLCSGDEINVRVGRKS